MLPNMQTTASGKFMQVDTLAKDGRHDWLWHALFTSMLATALGSGRSLGVRRSLICAVHPDIRIRGQGLASLPTQRVCGTKSGVGRRRVDITLTPISFAMSRRGGSCAFIAQHEVRMFWTCEC